MIPRLIALSQSGNRIPFKIMMCCHGDVAVIEITHLQSPFVAKLIKNVLNKVVAIPATRTCSFQTYICQINYFYSGAAPLQIFITLSIFITKGKNCRGFVHKGMNFALGKLSQPISVIWKWDFSCHTTTMNHMESEEQKFIYPTECFVFASFWWNMPEYYMLVIHM